MLNLFNQKAKVRKGDKRDERVGVKGRRRSNEEAMVNGAQRQDRMWRYG